MLLLSAVAFSVLFFCLIWDLSGAPSYCGQSSVSSYCGRFVQSDVAVIKKPNHHCLISPSCYFCKAAKHCKWRSNHSNDYQLGQNKNKDLILCPFGSVAYRVLLHCTSWVCTVSITEQCLCDMSHLFFSLFCVAYILHTCYVCMQVLLFSLLMWSTQGCKRLPQFRAQSASASMPLIVKWILNHSTHTVHNLKTILYWRNFELISLVLFFVWIWANLAV